MCGFDHATILSSSFYGVRKERLAQWPAFCVPNATKKPEAGGGGGIPAEKLGGGVQRPSWNPYLISDQNLWFSPPYFRPDQQFDTLFQTWSPKVSLGTGARDKLLRHVYGSSRKH